MPCDCSGFDCDWQSGESPIAVFGNRTRFSRRTDFGRRRCEFVRGRSIPVFRQAIGTPDVFKFSLGGCVVFSPDDSPRRPYYVIGIDYRRGVLTVPM